MTMLKKIQDKILGVFGDIKIFKWPMFILYHPIGYRVKGEDVRKIINTVQAGDIIIRGYTDYLDGYIIPGIFSHAGLYVGNNNVIHSMADGVFEEDIINFCRCDKIAILRPRVSAAAKVKAVEIAHKSIGLEYDFAFVTGDNKYYCTELIAHCYKDTLQKVIRLETATGFWGLVKKENVYLPDGFLDASINDIIFMNDFAKKELDKEKNKF